MLRQQLRESVAFGVASIQYDDISNTFNQAGIVPLADLLAQFKAVTLVERRDSHFQQFVMIKGNVDFKVDIVA